MGSEGEKKHELHNVTKHTHVKIRSLQSNTLHSLKSNFCSIYCMPGKIRYGSVVLIFTFPLHDTGSPYFAISGFPSGESCAWYLVIFFIHHAHWASKWAEVILQGAIKTLKTDWRLIGKTESSPSLRHCVVPRDSPELSKTNLHFLKKTFDLFIMLHWLYNMFSLLNALLHVFIHTMWCYANA